jgi:hypothetical protein
MRAAIMPWSVTYNSSLDLVEEVFSGLVTAAEFREAASKRISLEKETGATKILNDVSKVEVDASIMDVFNFPNKQYVQEGSNRKVRMALVMPLHNKSREIAEFFVTACLNRGWQVKEFSDRQEAIDWLS